MNTRSNVNKRRLRPSAADALILVDVQNDFLPGGALAVPAADSILEPLNRCVAAFERAGLPLFATRDWHPPQHCSFREAGGPWPAHCVAGTWGAEFPSRLALPATVRIVSKGQDSMRDAYSAFQGTGLEKQLRDLLCRRLFVGGLATDYCVSATVKDALASGFEAVVLRDAIRAVNLQPGDGNRALEEISAQGAQLASLEEVIG